MTKEVRDHWDCFLLSNEKVDALRAQGKFLKSMTHEEITELKWKGPYLVINPVREDARRKLYVILKKEDPNIPGYTKLSPYLYVKNRFDKRVVPGPSIDEFFEKVREVVGKPK